MTGISVLLGVVLLAQEGKAQASISSTISTDTISFDTFTGDGFDPNPSAGQLNSYTWSVSGLSDGSVPFGGSGTTNDFARGTSSGGVNTGGIYAFNNGVTGEMLGFQPTGTDLTPGEFVLKVQNTTGDTIFGLDFAYKAWQYNDKDRDNSIKVAYSMDNSSFTILPTLSFTSDSGASGSPSWDGAKRDTLLSSIQLLPNDSMYLRWSTEDSSGSGARDELGVDNIQMRGIGSVNAQLGLSPDTVCEGSFVDYLDSSEVTNDSIVSWVWDFDNGDTSHAEEPTYTHGSAGTYNIQLKVFTAGGLVDSANMDLEVEPVGDPSFHYDTTSYCDQESDPTPTITGDAGGTFSEGTGNLSIDSTTGTIDLSASNPGSYTVFYETGGSCSNATTFEVEVVSQYDASIDSLGPLCSAEDTVIDLQSPHEGGMWTGTGVVNDSTGGFNPNVAGIDTHEVIHEIGGACGDADTIDIVVDSTSDASIDSVGPYCIPEPTDILNAQDGGGTWSGPGIIDASTGEFSPNDADTGVHTIVYEIQGGCPDSDSIDIEVDSSKNAAIDPAGPVCEISDTLHLTAADSGGVWSGNGIVDTTEGLFDPGTAGGGSHTIVYQIQGGCSDFDTETIEVFPGNDATIDSSGPYCVLDPADTLTAADTGGTWEGPGIIDNTEGVFHPDSAGPGSHQIIYAFGPQDSCMAPDTTTLTVYGVPDPSIDSVDTLCIDGDSTMLSAVDSGGTWSGPGIVDAQQGLFDPTDAGLGTHSVEYSIQRVGACDSTDTVDITVVDGPTADFGWSNNGTTVSFSDSSSGHTGQLYEFGDGASDSDPNPTHTYSKDSLYTACLYVFDDNGCSDTLCQDIDLRDVSIAGYENEDPGFELRPNPSSERVSISLSNELRSMNPKGVELLDLSGRTVRSKELADGEKHRFDWDVSDLEAGTYLIRIHTEQEIAQRKLMVR